MTLVERLRDAASDLAVEAAEENERLAHELDKAHQLLSQHFGWLRDLEITKAKQAQEIEKLRAQLKRTNDALDKEFNNGIALCDAIERLKAAPVSGDELNLIKAFWRAEPSCMAQDCNADCNPMTAHCGRGP